MDNIAPIADRVLYEEVIQTKNVHEDGAGTGETNVYLSTENHIAEQNKVNMSVADHITEQIKVNTSVADQTQNGTFWEKQGEHEISNDERLLNMEKVEIEDDRDQTLLYHVADHPPISLTLISGFQVSVTEEQFILLLCVS